MLAVDNPFHAHIIVKHPESRLWMPAVMLKQNVLSVSQACMALKCEGFVQGTDILEDEDEAAIKRAPGRVRRDI